MSSKDSPIEKQQTVESSAQEVKKIIKKRRGIVFLAIGDHLRNNLAAKPCIG